MPDDTGPLPRKCRPSIVALRLSFVNLFFSSSLPHSASDLCPDGFSFPILSPFSRAGRSPAVLSRFSPAAGAPVRAVERRLSSLRRFNREIDIRDKECPSIAAPCPPGMVFSSGTPAHQSIRNYRGSSTTIAHNGGGHTRRRKK